MINVTLDTMKFNRATEGILAEALKYGFSKLKKILSVLMIRCINGEAAVPETWKMYHVILMEMLLLQLFM